jgi:vacuolar protein sorting-associated protein VTA1
MQSTSGKYYAAKLALDAPGGKSPEAQTFLLTLLDQLEADKQALGAAHEEALTNDTVGYSIVENFALRIFLNADNEDRGGQGSK